MSIRRTATALIALAFAGICGFWAYRSWSRSHSMADTDSARAEEADPVHAQPQRVRLSPQARANMRLVTKPVELTSYWRTIRIPGTVIERPGQSDIGVTTPLAGVVQRVAAVPGDSVRPGDELFTLRLISESLQTSQTELYRAVRELAINQEQAKRTEKSVTEGVVPEMRLIELQQQRQRLAATREAFGQDLKARGLTPEQTKRVEEGHFVTEIVVRAPRKNAGSKAGRINLIPAPSQASVDSTSAPSKEDSYEVEELKVNLGDHVQAGQSLATLANHGVLFIEGRVFKQEASLLHQTAQEGWPVRAEFAEETEKDWPPFQAELKIQFLASTIEPASQTFAFYLMLPNQAHEYQREGKVFRLWRFRPGQRARLEVAVERFADVFVLPVGAVVREGPEAYVFRANGDALDRKPVHILLEDREHIVVANDGSIAAGNHLAQNGAALLNRVLKAKSADSDGHGHDHHGHSHDH